MTLDGNWSNLLGSTMTLTTDGAGGLTGTYTSAVGNASGQYTLVGRYDQAGGPSVALGWTVAWENSAGDSNAATSWAGQCFTGQASGGSFNYIIAMWLLVTETDDDDYWASTQVMADVFLPNGATDEMREIAARHLAGRR